GSGCVSVQENPPRSIDDHKSLTAADFEKHRHLTHRLLSLCIPMPVYSHARFVLPTKHGTNKQAHRCPLLQFFCPSTSGQVDVSAKEIALLPLRDLLIFPIPLCISLL